MPQSIERVYLSAEEFETIQDRKQMKSDRTALWMLYLIGMAGLLVMVLAQFTLPLSWLS